MKLLLLAAAITTVDAECTDAEMCTSTTFDGSQIAYKMCYKSDLTVYYGNDIDPSCFGCASGYDATNNANTVQKCTAIAGTTWVSVTCAQAKAYWPTSACSTFASQQAQQTSYSCCTPASPPAAVNPCFPSSSIATKADGKPSRVDALKAGDQIVAATADGALTLDTVSLLSIAKPEAHAAFRVLTTATNHTLTLTDGHHVPVGAACCSALKPAKDVVVGDTVWVVSAGATVATTVTTSTTTWGAGLHSPVLTNGGFPVVDGVVTAFDAIGKVRPRLSQLSPSLPNRGPGRPRLYATGPRGRHCLSHATLTPRSPRPLRSRSRRTACLSSRRPARRPPSKRCSSSLARCAPRRRARTICVLLVVLVVVVLRTRYSSWGRVGLEMLFY